MKFLIFFLQLFYFFLCRLAFVCLLDLLVDDYLRVARLLNLGHVKVIGVLNRFAKVDPRSNGLLRRLLLIGPG